MENGEFSLFLGAAAGDVMTLLVLSGIASLLIVVEGAVAGAIPYNPTDSATSRASSVRMAACTS